MYDFIVVGGGIVGMSTAMQLATARPGAKIAVVEKESGPAQHQTGHNSGVIHAGIYYTPGSLKAKFCLAGNSATRAFCDQHQIPYLQCGKLLVATSALEMKRMAALWERTAANGLTCHWLDSNEISQCEPNIRGLGGILVPDSGIVNYRAITEKTAERVGQQGGEIHYHAEVIGIDERHDAITVHTTRGDFQGKLMVSCAGLMADRIVKMLGQTPDFIICPFRGEYYLLDHRHDTLVNHLIYPIPDPATPFLGVHLTRTIEGRVTIGPNAVLAMKREGYRKTDFSLKDVSEMMSHPGVLKVLTNHFLPGINEMKNSLSKRNYLQTVQKYCPRVTLEDLTPYPAGVRAQAISREGKLVDDFLFVHTPRSVNVCNAPSPAATSAIPIGAHIVALVYERPGETLPAAARRAG